MSDPNDPNDPDDPFGDFVYFYDGNGNVGQVVDLAHDANDSAGALVMGTGSWQEATCLSPWFARSQGDRGGAVENGDRHLARRCSDPRQVGWARSQSPFSTDPYGQRINHAPYVPEYDQPGRFSTKRFDVETGGVISVSGFTVRRLGG